MRILSSLQFIDKKIFSNKLHTSHENINASHIAVMDGLRGIAILLVFFFHVWQLSWLDFTTTLHSPIYIDFIARFGFLGVETFFFISGFCLFYPHARHCFEQYPLASWQDYLLKRALKILPSYLLAILLILVLFKWEFSKEQLLLHLSSHFLFIHNFFPETHYSINGVFWSLAVEVQFYLVFPVLAKFFRARPVIVTLLMSGCAIAYRQYIMITKQEGGFLYTQYLSQMPAFLDLFSLGMLTAYILVLLRNRQNIDRYMPLFSLLMLLGLAGFVALIKNVDTMAGSPDGMIEWQARYRSLIGISLMLAAIGGHFANPWVQKILNNRFLAFFSLISYNLYIWHQFIAAKLFNARFPEPLTPDPHDDPQWQIVFTVFAMGLAIVIATLLTLFWERPFLRQKFNFLQASQRE